LGLIGCVSIVSCLNLLYLPILFFIKIIAITFVEASSIYFSLRDALLALPWSWQVFEVDSKRQLKVLNQRGERLCQFCMRLALSIQHYVF
jgi:hypothetical protein